MICGALVLDAQPEHSVRHIEAPNTSTTTTFSPGHACPQDSQRKPRGHRSVTFWSVITRPVVVAWPNEAARWHERADVRDSSLPSPPPVSVTDSLEGTRSVATAPSGPSPTHSVSKIKTVVEPRLLPTGEAARAVGVSPRTLQRWVREGLVKPTQLTAGGHHRWLVD